jgi:hypothetical protein
VAFLLAEQQGSVAREVLQTAKSAPAAVAARKRLKKKARRKRSK